MSYKKSKFINYVDKDGKKIRIKCMSLMIAIKCQQIIEYNKGFSCYIDNARN